MQKKQNGSLKETKKDKKHIAAATSETYLQSQFLTAEKSVRKRTEKRVPLQPPINVGNIETYEEIYNMLCVGGLEQQ